MRRAAVVTSAVVTALVVGIVLRPAPPSLPESYSGDAELAAQVRDVVGEETSAAAVAVVEGGEVRTVVIGAPPAAQFEVGWVTCSSWATLRRRT